ncbi:MAG: anaerobic sulfatase maturase [Verrucomicrobia bacterium]|nr:anaerobic sulfatase maturase [Verrucomicrobiota bacterium]MBU4289431.1 anaerobic sulfatase maturase [Verrucomicrobiota bacterium]MBU4429312.1 anaerobic sulfatase maturase [Verrucomicrobiota bacterium]MBU4497245.1 anaerobic sulfatase maturase [Verrucomicrobiota bacterium]MCG2679138.1 anaerobic sulfatase maturase [Kiritimatiellia bacterium]
MHKNTRSYAVLAKPAGARCNLACRYCFYLEKNKLLKVSVDQMPSAVLESYTRQYVEIHGDVEIQFPWQGGEPMLCGLDFFREVVRLQQRYGRGRRISNTFQTNGILLDDAWSAFFAKHGFLVGLSIDGPQKTHDFCRIDRAGQPTFERVMAAMAMLKEHEVPFNTLTVIHRGNAAHGLEIYRFLKEHGGAFMQFIPLVERETDAEKDQPALDWAAPPFYGYPTRPRRVSPLSVTPDAFADFYIRVFDEWVRKDVGRVFVQFFDAALGNVLGAPSGVCCYSAVCGHAAALEVNGDLYACDHYVYPEYRLGNIMETPMQQLLNSRMQRDFGEAKQFSLPACCQTCDVLPLCNGGCPKNRFGISAGGKSGLNYLCAGYQQIFRHMQPVLQRMAALIRTGMPASAIMTQPH